MRSGFHPEMRLKKYQYISLMQQVLRFTAGLFFSNNYFQESHHLTQACFKFTHALYSYHYVTPHYLPPFCENAGCYTGLCLVFKYIPDGLTNWALLQLYYVMHIYFAKCLA